MGKTNDEFRKSLRHSIAGGNLIAPREVAAVLDDLDEALAWAENAERGGEVLADAYKDLRIMMTKENAAIRAELKRKTEALKFAASHLKPCFFWMRGEKRCGECIKCKVDAALAEPKAGGPSEERGDTWGSPELTFTPVYGCPSPPRSKR